MNEIVKPVAQWISNNIPLSIGILLFIFCIFFEISKIKIYPLKWLWKAISWPFRKIDEQRTQSFKKLMEEMKSDMDTKLKEMTTAANNNCDQVKACFKDLSQKLTDLETRFDNLDAKQVETDERLDRLAAARIKNHVLNFARQCRKNEPHSHEDFSNLAEEVKEYKKLVEKYGWTNDVFSNDWSYILELYRNGRFTD